MNFNSTILLRAFKGLKYELARFVKRNDLFKIFPSITRKINEKDQSY